MLKNPQIICTSQTSNPKVEISLKKGPFHTCCLTSWVPPTSISPVCWTRSWVERESDRRSLKSASGLLNRSFKDTFFWECHQKNETISNRIVIFWRADFFISAKAKRVKITIPSVLTERVDMSCLMSNPPVAFFHLKLALNQFTPKPRELKWSLFGKQMAREIPGVFG